MASQIKAWVIVVSSVLLRTLVEHALGLADQRARNGVEFHDSDLGRHANDGLDAVLQFLADSLDVGLRQLAGQVALQFATYFQVVEVTVAGNHDLVIARQAGVAQDLFLDLGREDVDATDHQHVVGPASDLADATEGARSRRQQAGQVAGAVADDREGFLGQRGEDRFALFAVGQHFAGFRVDGLGVEMVFPDHRAVLGLDALAGNARPHHFGQAVDVDGVEAQLALDLAAHALAPRLGAEDADLQRNLVRLDAQALELLGDDQRVGRRDHDDFRLEVHDLLDLLFGLAAGHRHGAGPQAFDAVVGAEAAGEHAIAVGDMDHVASAATGRTDRAGNNVGPVVDIVLGVADDDRFAGRAAGGVQAGQLIARHGEQTERVVVTQVGLGHERELGQVGQALQVVWMDAFFLAALAVRGSVVVAVAYRPLQALKLQRGNFLAAGGFDRVEFAGLWHLGSHVSLLSVGSGQSACCRPAITSPL